jgi:alpha,alpha-trehalose phosphorylase
MSPRHAGAARLRERLEEHLRHAPADHRFPVRDWQIVERRAFGDSRPALESIFAVANGYLGMRGTPEEGTPAHEPGAVLNGFHETWPIVYPEDAYGLARTGQTIVNATDGSIIRLFVDDEPLDLATARVLRFERVLDMQIGVLTREVEFETPVGHRLLVRSRRLASLADRHLAAMDYEVVALDGDARIAISSELVTHGPREGSDDPRRGSALTGKVLEPLAGRACGRRAVLSLATRNSGLEMACGMEHAIECTREVGTRVSTDGDGAQLVVQADLRAGDSLRLGKYVAYHWAPQAAASDLLARVDRTLDRAAAEGYDMIEFDHRRRVEEFWSRSDVQLDGAPDLQQAVRFNLFQLMQATARSEGFGVPAKGLTGHGYEGHYFWDTEIYVVPFLAHTSPQWARQVLRFRCAMLEAARRRARETGHGGALYPWRTISGEEASAWYAAGTAQYHINADIAYAIRQYGFVTGDLDFVLGDGAQVLVETARLWMELGFFSERKDGQFCINGVTGPDEYTTVVDNNAYTNLMARENLRTAVQVVEWLGAQEPEAHAELVDATGVSEAELAEWRRASALMYVPRHEELGIALQDEHFLQRKPWDFDNTPADRYPLLLHHHPLELYRHQVIKQTDVVLATYLVGDHFSDEEKRRTFDYYDPLTTGDSTLSACIQSVIASEVGYPEAALEYFVHACAVDLADAHGNTADGIHIASCGGTWLALVAGFAGLRESGGEIAFHPRLPADWERLRFKVQIRGQLIEVDMSHRHTAYRLLEGSGLMIRDRGEDLRLSPGVPVVRPVVAEPAGGDVTELPRAA